MADRQILVINTGSSSLKFGMYSPQNDDEHLVFEGLADGISRSSGRMNLKDANGKTVRQRDGTFANHHDALALAAKWLSELAGDHPVAIGHRIVHGGPQLVSHQPITHALLVELKNCIHFAPLHIPIALQLIEESQNAYPGIPQFACFDTAFHRTIPEVSSRFAIPMELHDEGLHRYGFHGLSYESIVHRLGPDIPRRTVIAHLGSGASIAAVLEGRSVDTSMGLTPAGGVPMATRSGDLDPGILLYLLRQKHMSVDSLETLLGVPDLLCRWMS